MGGAADALKPKPGNTAETQEEYGEYEREGMEQLQQQRPPFPYPLSGLHHMPPLAMRAPPGLTRTPRLAKRPLAPRPPPGLPPPPGIDIIDAGFKSPRSSFAT